MRFLSFGRFFRRLFSVVSIALVMPTLLFGEGRRIEIMDVHSGHHYIIDPESPFDAQGSPTFSPDQKWVAYDAVTEGDNFSKTRLLITKTDGSQKEPTDLVSGCMPSFSKDGKRIAYSSPSVRGVWVIDVDGKNKKRISKSGWSMAFSPQDNDVVAYGMHTNAGPNIQIHNLKTNETRLALPEEIAAEYKQIVWNFQWSHDASQIVFCGRTKVAGDVGDCVIATIGTGENPEHKVQTVEEVHCRVICHPLTNEVFYSKRMPSKGTHRIFSVNPEIPRKLRTPVYLASQPDECWNMIGDFSKDGNLIAFTSKPIPTESAIDAKSFQEEVQPGLAAVAKLKLARAHLRRGEYDAFVNELMGELDDSEKEAGVEHAKGNANHWLGAIDEAISEFDHAKVTDGSVVFPLHHRDGELKMIRRNDEWILETNHASEF